MLLRQLIASLALLAGTSAAWSESCNPPSPPVGSGGAWFKRYQAWCRACGGTPSVNASPATCNPGPNWGRGSGGSAVGGGSPGAELGRQIGGVLGELIREGLFGNPQQDAARQAELAAQRQREEQERQRLAAERARQDEERYQRLSASLLEFNPAPQLSLMGTQSGSGELQLMLGEEAEGSTNPALAELTRAAAWSTLAARAPTAEDSVMLADAAFQSLIGGKVNLPPPPPDVKGVPVGPWLTEVEALKKQYLAQRTQLPDAWKPALEAMERRHEFMQLESKVREFELRMYQGVRRPPVPIDKEASEKAHAEAERARQAAEEAARLRRQAEDEARRAFDAAAKRQYDVNGLEQGLRAWLSSFAAEERKPDSYYYLGFEDGSQCFSQNAGPRCDKARAPKADYENCLASYRLGYTAGERIKKSLLQTAFEKGERDRAAGRSYADTDTRADGPCRAEYIMSYNNGRLGVELSRVGR